MKRRDVRHRCAVGSPRKTSLCGLLANGVALLFGVLATRHLPRDESSRLDRARAAGELGV